MTYPNTPSNVFLTTRNSGATTSNISYAGQVMALKTTSGLQAATSKTTKPWTRTSSSSNRLSNFSQLFGQLRLCLRRAFSHWVLPHPCTDLYIFPFSLIILPSFFLSSWMGVSVRMVLTTACASTTPCLFVLIRFLLCRFPFLFCFVCSCL